MRIRSLFILCSIAALSANALAQTKEVTNVDLEKYKQKRVQAEKDLRENYEKLGFPSPEEMERQNVQDAKEREELFVKLRQQRLERERLETEQQRFQIQMRQYDRPTMVVQDSVGYGGFVYSYPTYWNRFRGRRFDRRFGGDIIWRATPGGVIYEPGSRSSYIWTPRINMRPSIGWRNQR